ncbi:Cmx/CmrA family chloramphenicol efflux MFS transporter [Amycolatopsis samaneae]|uniref:Cmx/CmrA family chloramphenicol efflux MFS transporter n=1 Tax=Amycolatopsis samaneae TaxID=664691 RepID=A0ABW5GDB7_9PSEU
MPFALYLLGLAVFAQGTSEFMLSGLVADIAADLHVSIPAAGMLTSAFAAGMVLGAPVMALLSLRLSRRGALVGFLSAFIVVHVLGAVITSFGLLLLTRVAAALANAGFWAVALAAANAMVRPELRGRATSIVVSGVTVACVAGVPAGALLGQYWGWRSAFWAVAAVSLPALFAILRTIPGGRSGTAETGARKELRVLREPRLLVVLLLGALVNGGTFGTFTYLAPLFTTAGGLDAGWVPALLAIFGVGSFAGVTLGGRLADRRPGVVLFGGSAALLLGWALLAVTAANLVVAVALVFVLGVLSFGVGSTLIPRVFAEAPGAPTLAGGLGTAAFNVGAVLGPWLGGLAVGGDLGFRAAPWVSAALVALALVLAVATQRNRAGTPGHHVEV